MNLISYRSDFQIPVAGLGTYKLEGKECVDAVKYALENNIKLIDTASFYANEESVGDGIIASNVDRKDVFLVSKMWTDEMRSETATQSLDRSLLKLKTDYLDLYLAYWPVEKEWKSSYEQMLNEQVKGKVKHVGVCNFTEVLLEDVKNTFGEYPVLNQVECHPIFQQKELQAFCKTNKIVFQSWRSLMNGEVNKFDALNSIGEKYNKSPYQIALKYFTECNVVVIPKSSKPERIVENFNLFDFELSNDEMQTIENLNKEERQGPDPHNFDF